MRLGEDVGSAVVASLHRYPVKGLQGERLPTAVLGLNGLPWDRAFGLANGSTPVEEFGSWTTYEAFEALSTRPDLGGFTAEVLEAAGGTRLRIRHPDGDLLDLAVGASGRLPTGEDQAPVVDAWFRSPTSTSTVDLIASGVNLWDVEAAPVSIINLATVGALSRAAGRPVDPARFRANVYIDGLPAWSELDLVGRTAVIGGATLEFFWPIDRCSATSVRPGVGGSDLNLPGLLKSQFGHIYCGVYARVVRPGRIATGDAVITSSARRKPDVPGLPESDRGLAPRWARVARVQQAARHVVDVEVVDSAELLSSAAPGQHLRLHHADGSVGWRNYTISGVSERTSRISVRLEHDGRVSPWVHELVPDDQVLVSGPFGDAVMDDGLGPLVLITAGIGITPTLPILAGLVRAGSGRRVTAVHVARTSADLVHWDEVMDAVAALPGGSAHLFLTAETDLSRSPVHHAGRPDEDFLRSVLHQATETTVHLCGSPSFTDSMRAIVEGAGVPDEAVRFDPFFSPPAGDLEPRRAPFPGPFQVQFGTGTTASWSSDSGTILDLADATGQRIPSSCRSGVCGTCISAIRGEIAYVLDPWVKPASGGVVLCCAVPVSDVVVLPPG